MDNIYKAVQLTIDSQNLALSKTPTHVYIANQYVDTNDTPLITAPFIIQKALENGAGVVDIVSSTIGSIYEVRLLCDAEVLISGYFYMPPMNVNFSELELYTSYPPRTPPVVNEFWQKTENFILEKTNTLLNFVQVFNSLSSMRLSLGYLEELLTTKKSNLVGAINEVYKKYEGVGSLYEKNVAAAGAGAKGWVASLVVDGDKTQKQINDTQKNRNLERVSFSDFNILPSNTAQQNSDHWDVLNNTLPNATALDIFAPPGTYKFARGLLITRPHQIRGVGAGEQCKSVFDFKDATPVGTATYKAGVFVAHSSTWDDTTYGIVNKPSGQVVTAGIGAVLENIAVINSSEHGIIKNAPCNFFGVAAMHNAKHGILTAANVDPTMTVYGGRIGGIANQGANVQCASLFNGKSGFSEFGSDANVINNDTCLAAYNSEFGFFGGNLLGSVHTSCQAHGNTLGDYVMQGALKDNSGLPQTPANNLYNGCYAEGQRDSTYSVNARSLVIGALGGKPKADTVNQINPTIVGLLSKQISAATDAQHVYDGKGGAFTKVGLDGIKIGSDVVKTASFDIKSNALGRVYLGSDGNAGIVFFLEDFNTTLKANQPWLPNGLSIGNTHSQTVGTAAPTTGTWDRGNIVWNEQPTSGQPIGWVCVEFGSPGTWKSFGTISN